MKIFGQQNIMTDKIESLWVTAPKKTWSGQWFPQGSFFVAIIVTGGQESAPKAPRFLAAKRYAQ